MTARIITAALAVAAIAGCGGGSTESASSATATQATTSRPDSGYADSERARIDRNNYANAKAVCSAFPARKVARDLGVPEGSDLTTIATAYAHGYRPPFRPPVYRGCLAGLNRRASR